MTYQPAQLQDLIRAIDEVLGKSSPRLPWVMSSEADQQRRILEETRRYLVQMQQQGAASSSALAHDPMNQGYAVPLSSASPAESAQQVLQAMLQEMTYLRTTVMQPLRNDLEVLYRQRDRLLQEIHELEAQRQQAVLTDATPPPSATLPAADQQRLISEFLQTLMGRLQADLSGQVAQMLTEIEAQATRDSRSDPLGSRASVTAGESNPAMPLSTAEMPALTPAERLQQIQRIQAQTDQLLLKLDNSLRVIFESLQSNIETYQESLSLGLDKMNALGQQGEAIFAAMVNRLAEQLSREASHYLQASIQDVEWQPATSLPQSSVRPSAEPSATGPTTEQWPPASLETVAPSPRPQSDSLDPIDQLLSELEDELTVFQVPEPDSDEELTVFQVPEPSQESPTDEGRPAESEADPIPADTRPMGSTAYPGMLDEIDDLEALELLTQELERLELASVPELPELEDDAEFTALDDGDEALTMFQIDESVMTDLSMDEPLGDPRTVLQIDAEDAEEAEEAVPASPGLSIEDLDSALDLLGQISTQLDAGLEQTEPTDAPDRDDLTPGFGVEADSATPSYDELDAFYESLFGIDAAGSAGETADLADLADDEPVDRHLSDAEQRALVSPDANSETTRFGNPATSPATPATPHPADDSEDESDLTNTRLMEAQSGEAQLGSLDSLDQALFGGQADPAIEPAIEPAEGIDGAIASPSVDELVELLSEFINSSAATSPAEETTGLAALAEQTEQGEQTDTAASQPLVPAERSPEAVEHLLFGESPEPPRAQELDDELSLTKPHKPEVIRSLNDLLHLMAAESAEELAIGLPTNGQATDAEDRYEPANPGEDLLGSDDVLTSPRPDVQVTQNTLEQLAADLSDLEGLAADAFSTDLAALHSSTPPLPTPIPSSELSKLSNASETSDIESDSLADWMQFSQESLHELPDPLSTAGPAAGMTDEGQSYWQGGSLSQNDPTENDPTEDDLFISSLFPIEDESDDEMTLLLDGPLPGLSSPLPQKANAPLTTPESLADWVNALDETELPPDREDLSLNDFQAVMHTEPLPLDERGAIAHEQGLPHPASQSPSDQSPSDQSPSIEDSWVEAFSESPAENVGFDAASLDEFAADFAAPVPPAPSQEFPTIQAESASPASVPDSLEDLFADLPPAPLPSPPQSSGSLTDSILENLSLSVPTPPPGEAAFTLSGLESLFEDLPSVGEVTPVPPPESPSTNLTAADLTHLFADAEPAPAADPLDPATPPDEASLADPIDSPSEAKKKSSDPPNRPPSPPPDLREPRGFGRLQPNTRRPQ